MSQPSQPRSKLKKELYKLVVARSDIASAQKTCRIILEKIKGLSDEMYAPLFHAAVVAYGRPFVDNKSTGPLSRHWGEFSDSRLQSAHQDLVKTRHELVAHSDLTVREVHIIPPAARTAHRLPPGNGVAIRIGLYYYPQPMFVDAFDVCDDLIKRLTSRIDELLSELYDQASLPNESIPLVFDDGL